MLYFGLWPFDSYQQITFVWAVIIPIIYADLGKRSDNRNVLKDSEFMNEVAYFYSEILFGEKSQLGN